MPRLTTAPRPSARRRLAARLGLVALLAAALDPLGAQVVRSGSAATAAELTPIVDAYRGDLGTLNPNVPGSFGAGRREVNWDGVPEPVSSPNPFPGDFFNGAVPGRARGIAFSTPGAGFEVSAAPGTPGFEFGNLNPSYPDEFIPFSSAKLFTALASNVTDVTFFVPGTTEAAAVTGFGAVFADVDVANATSLSFYGLDDELLGTYFASTFDGGLSFLGVSYADAIVTRVRIVTGTVAPGPTDGPSTDVVVMDDFIYGEPVAASVVPEPSTWLLLASGLAGIGGVAAVRRRPV